MYRNTLLCLFVSIKVLWTGLPGPNFHLLIGCGILDLERDALMHSDYGFNEILKVSYNGFLFNKKYILSFVMALKMLLIPTYEYVKHKVPGLNVAHQALCCTVCPATFPFHT